MLLGCVVVAINFFVSQRLVELLVLEKSLKPGVIIAYLLKFGLSGLLIFVAVVKWGLNIPGIMLGLSSVLLASVATVFVRKPAGSADE
jgi:hypothetical protein